MYNRKRSFCFEINLKALFLCFSLPLTLHASFLESTLGTAVVNDATASYYNPASLTLLTHQQLIALGSISAARTEFTGQTIQSGTGFSQEGTTLSKMPYYLPSMYLGVPTTNNSTFGVAVVSNFFNKHIDENSILRYVQASNNVQDIDVVPALGFKLNQFLSLGLGVAFSHATFLQQPISGVPDLSLPDAQSTNESSGNGLGAEAGFLLTPSKSTLIGFNYRRAVTYELSGSSVLQGNPSITSNDFHFNFWTPARSVVSINQRVSDSLGFIGTVQRVQWSIFNEVDVHGIATRVGSKALIANAKIPYHLHDTWIVTVGNYYHITPKWVVRVAGNYNQAPDSGRYQISSGDSLIIGASMGYEINKNIVIDGSFSHAFIQNQYINIVRSRDSIHGENRVSQDSIALKLTINK